MQQSEHLNRKERWTEHPRLALDLYFSSNVSFLRITVLAAICLSQVFMMWKFINFQLRRWREHSQVQTLKKKPAPAKSKSKKDKGELRAQKVSTKGTKYPPRKYTWDGPSDITLFWFLILLWFLANGVNGVNSHAADSPRARKEKSS